MARPKKADTLETPEQKLARLEAENARLLAEKESAERSLAELGNVEVDPQAMKYMNEIAAIKRSGRVDTEKTIVKEFTDHKNISLWTKWGKRIGPMHRENALRTLQSFYGIGIMLSTQQPTQKEIEEWLASPAGKKWKDGEDKKRESNIKTMKRGELEKILKAMSAQFGLTTEALMSLKKSHEVMTTAEGRKEIGV